MKEIKNKYIKIAIGLKTYDEVYENPMNIESKYMLLENNKIHIVFNKINLDDIVFIKNLFDKCLYIKIDYYQIPKLNKDEFTYEVSEREISIICNYNYFDNVDGERLKYLKKKHKID